MISMRPETKQHWKLMFEAEQGDPSQLIENKTNNRHVFWSRKRNCYVMYSKQGLWQVEKRDPERRNWTHVTQLLTKAEAEKLIRRQRDTPLNELGEFICDILKGEVESIEDNGTVRFRLDLSEGATYLRYKPTVGLSIVELAIDNWVARRLIMKIEDLYTLLRKIPQDKKGVRDHVRRACEQYWNDRVHGRGAA